MSELNPSRVALIGAGTIAQSYARILADCEFARPVGIADVRLEAALEWVRRASGAAMSDPGRLLELRPDVVVLCTPPSSHAELAEPLLAAGVAVLSEKPLSSSLASAMNLHDDAVRHDAVLGMAAKFRFCADVNTVRRMISGGELGSLRLIETCFTSRVDMRLRWNSHRRLSGGGVIIDNGTHAIDLVRYLCGPIREVLATEQARPPGFEVEDTAVLHLVTESGVDVSVDLSWSIDKSRDDFLRIHGTEGEARVGWRSSAWRHYGEDWQVFGSGYDKFAAMSGALDQFCRAARRTELPAVTSSEAVADAAVVDAAYRSLEQGGWVKLDPLWLS